jgi:DNA gyrase/topoisomerase IV subunit A
MRKIFCLIIPALFLFGCGYSSGDISKIEGKIESRYKEDLSKLQKEVEKLRKEREELNTRLEEEKKQSSSLKAELEEAQRKLELAEKGLNNPKTTTNPLNQNKSVQGAIRSIHTSTNLVIISLGKNDSVSAGIELGVYRKDNFLGKIKIDTVGQDWSSAHSVKIEELRLFQVGDNVISLPPE